MSNTAPGWRPGDSRADTRSMLRVDQAGEYGATRIYAGQLAVLGSHPSSRPIARMQSQEEGHLRTFDQMMVERGIRPTLLQPVWNVAGHALGAATALMSPSAAMALIPRSWSALSVASSLALPLETISTLQQAGSAVGARVWVSSQRRCW